MSKTSGLVSVVVTAYNAESTIGKTIDSIVRQTYRNMEIIIVDDGSTDSTAAIVKSRNDERIVLLRQRNSGQPSARNAGFRACRGEYIAVVDADDLWASNKIEKQMRAVVDSTEDVALCYCDAVYFRNNLGAMYRLSAIAQPKSGAIARDLYLGNFICSATPLIAKSALEAVGFWDQRYRFGEDWNMWIKLASVSKCIYLDEVLAYHRKVASSMTASARHAAVMRDLSGIISDHAGAFGNNARCVSQAAIFSGVASRLLLEFKRRSSLRLAMRALRLNPTFGKALLLIMPFLPPSIIGSIISMRRRRLRETLNGVIVHHDLVSEVMLPCQPSENGTR
jgi:glycosyltransferase involved in cell wall biosynthesis